MSAWEPWCVSRKWKQTPAPNIRKNRESRTVRLSRRGRRPVCPVEPSSASGIVANQRCREMAVVKKWFSSCLAAMVLRVAIEHCGSGSSLDGGADFPVLALEEEERLALVQHNLLDPGHKNPVVARTLPRGPTP